MNIFKKLLIRRKLSKSFRKRLGYPLNLKHPRTYCEKIQWLKFNSQGNDQKVIDRADKYAVRSFVEEMGFGETLIPLHGVWKTPEEIEWAALPTRFVLKLNNGSGERYRWFVKDKHQFPKHTFEAEARRTMPESFGEDRGQFHYSRIPPRIIAEEFLEDADGGLKDYKFYCFHGTVAFLSVETGKIEGTPVRQYYDRDWNRSHVGFFADLPEPEEPFEKPRNLDLMIRMAEALGRGYPHVRVDLYNIEGRVYFGELTYTPENGLTRWNPPALDLEFGALMDIHEITH